MCIYDIGDVKEGTWDKSFAQLRAIKQSLLTFEKHIIIFPAEPQSAMKVSWCMTSEDT